MSQNSFEVSVREQLSEIKVLLTKLDDAIRGRDGAPGILIRLDRLEIHRSRHGKLLWTVVVAFCGALASYGIPLISEMWRGS